MKKQTQPEIEFAYPAITRLTAEEKSLVLQMRDSWQAHLDQTAALSPQSIEQRHNQAHAEALKDCCADSIAKLLAHPDVETLKQRARKLATDLAEALDVEYRNQYLPKLLTVLQRISDACKTWLVGYGHELKPRYDALNLPFVAEVSGAPAALVNSIIRACSAFIEKPEAGFTQIADIVPVTFGQEDEV